MERPYIWVNSSAVSDDSLIGKLANDFTAVDRSMPTELVSKANPYIKKVKPALPEIDHVIFNNPATIVFWKDDTKTVVKVNPGECYDPEKGLAMAMVKKALGNEGNYYNTIFKHLQGVDIPVLCYAKEYFEVDAAAYHAYSTLLNAFNNKKTTKADLLVAIEEALGFLGEMEED